MAKKRGGLAGIWDRNKGVIKTLAPIALGAIPGVGVPLAAAAGAAMGGLDRPGKGGIGLDVGGALKGGVTGYLGGQTGKAVAGGVKSLLTAGAKSPLDTLAAPDMASKVGMTGPANIGASSIGGAADVAKSVAPQVSRFGQAAKFARENKDLIGMAGKGIMSMMPAPGEEAAMMNAETGRMRLEEEQRQAKMEEERRQRIASILMPFARQQYPSYFGGQ